MNIISSHASFVPVKFERAIPAAVPIRSRPLAALNLAMCELDMSAASVRDAIDAGKLVAFDIALQRGGRACLRILMASIEHYRDTRGKPFVMAWQEMFKLIWPFIGPTARGVSLARSLNCDRGHLENLTNAKLLHLVRASAPGPGGSPIVTVASVEAFLKGRLVI